MLPGTSNEQGDVVHSQEKNSSANGAPLGLQIKQEKSDSVDMVSEDANGSEIPGDVEMEVDGSEAATFAPTNGSQEPHDVPKRKLEEGDTDQDSKKSKLNEYSNDAVIEYVNKAKEKHLEMFLDHLMELFFLEHSGNFMEFLIWKKKPPTDTLRQYITVNADQELADLLASKVLVESTHQSAKTPSLPQPVENISNLTPSLSSSIQTTPVIGSSSRSTFTPSEPPVISDTPETGPVSAKIPATVPRAQLISRTSAKNACSALISSSGAAAYAGRPHATRQHSISAVYESSIGSQEQIVERAKQEAHVVQRIAELRKEGLWSLKRLPKVQEPPRAKAHWDYLLEEMSWLATDFAQERKWKKTAAKKCARMVMKYHQDKQAQKEKERREQHAKLRKIASTLAKEIKGFWANVEKVLDFKQRTKLEEKRKKALDMHLNFIVGQTEQYSSWLAEGLANTKSNAPSIDDAATEVGTVDSSQPLEEPQTSDNDFEPAKLEETDDEETIAKEEAEASDVSDHGELDLLQKESEMPIEELLKTLPGAILSTPASISSSHPPSVDEAHSSKKDDDEEFEGIDEEDDEETIEREEKEEASADYADELKELDDENNLTVEQLMEKYKGAYDEGFDLPVISDDETVVDDEDEMEVDDVDDNETEEDTESEEESEKEEIGMEFLIHPETESAKKALSEEVLADVPHPSLEITDIAAGAEQIQPKGNTLSTAKVVTKVPFLLKYTLREYQHIGLDWLVAMYDKKLNGILADEMGLGKTIQTIALLAHLACEKGIWGPHLIVVPTSVMLNWEMEIKKWCPAFKTLTYYGTPKERKAKRQGWTKPNQFHICITSYKLVVQDHQSFRRKKWRYLILDEAQHIKNFKSQRWQMLLNFNTSRRLLLTGTPLQNNLMELWSLMHFLMPSVFASHKDFKDWFVNPVTGMIEGNHEFNEALIRRLHKVLRPFLLRRLKSQVEQQMPKKYEHVVLCRLSKRQRFLYEEFMSLTKTKETLASGNFLSVINVLMQLRKVCNHPNLFETRPTVSPFAMEGLTYETASLATKPLLYNPLEHINLDALGLNISQSSLNVSAFVSHRVKKFQTPSKLIEEIDSMPDSPPPIPKGKIRLQFRTSKSQAPLSPGRATRSNLPLKSSNQGVGSSPATRHIVLVTSSVKTNGKETNSLISKSSGTSLMKKVADDVSSVKPNKTNSQKEKDTPLVEPVEEEPMDIDDTTLELGKEINQKFILPDLVSKTEHERAEKLRRLGRLNSRRCSIAPFYPSDLIEQCTVCQAASDISSNCPERSDFSIGQGYYHCLHAKSDERNSKNYWSTSRTLNEAISTPIERMNSLKGHMNRFVTAVSPVAAPSIQMHVSHPEPSKKRTEQLFEHDIRSEVSPKCDILHPYISNIRTQFPELRLIQYDCGKLQTLDTLLWKLKSGGHRALIFTQMSRMLDIFEQFLSYHGHTYLRLDGATKIEMRQSLMERFNADKKIFCFILSTRSGGVGVNLTGADTVIFYDSDWNPTMDAQAQDRCHRIGQTRDVHIYRLISERTIEENILKKAQQKRLLGDVAIEEGNFTTAFFKQNAITDLFGDGLKGMGDDLSSLLDDPVVSVSTTQLSEASVSEDPNLRSKWEEALEDVEENTDIAAAKTARAEAAAEYAEFDETIPLDQEAPGEEKSPAEEELDQLVNELTPVERYALQYLEANQDPATTEQLKLAEEEIEAQKKDWEFERLQALKKEAERGSEESDSDKDDIVTMSRQDAYNQVAIECD
ncbi:Helicase domino [Halotydeus destructor]|nr:Helicase domino [Halotydeus destructor]